MLALHACLQGDAFMPFFQSPVGHLNPQEVGRTSTTASGAVSSSAQPTRRVSSRGLRPNSFFVDGGSIRQRGIGKRLTRTLMGEDGEAGGEEEGEEGEKQEEHEEGARAAATSPPRSAVASSSNVDAADSAHHVDAPDEE